MLDALHQQAGLTVSLGEVAHFIRGVTFKPEDVTDRDAPGAIWCLRTRNVQSELDTVDVWGLDPALVRRQEQIVEEGDILVSTANSWNLIGKCSWLPRLPAKTTFGGFVSVLRAQKQVIEPRYLYRWFSSEPVQALVRSFGRKTTNISNLDVGRCLGLPIPLPPLSEQRRIAAILDQADALRAKRRMVLSELTQMTQAIFLEMFDDPATNRRDWPTYQCAHLCHRINVGVVVRPASYYKENGVPAIRGTNIKKSGIDLTDIVYFSKTDSDGPLSKSRLRSGDLVIVRTGQPGLAAVVPDDLDGANAIDVIIVTPDTAQIHPIYMRELLNSKSGREVVVAQSRGQIQQHFNVGSLAAAQLIVPPLELQRTFERRVTANVRLQDLEQSSLASLDALFASLQHRAFRGEL